MAIISPIDKNALKSQLQQNTKSQINIMLKNLNNAWTQIFNSIWSNQILSPQEAIDSFGADAASLFQLSAQAQAFLNSVQPGVNVLTPPFQFTVNQDGTVTVGDPISPQSGQNI